LSPGHDPAGAGDWRVLRPDRRDGRRGRRELWGAVGLVAVAQRDRRGYGRGGRIGSEPEKGLSERLRIADCGLRIADWTVWVSRPQADFPDRTVPRKSAIRNPQFISCPTPGDWQITDTPPAPPRAAVGKSSAPYRRTCPSPAPPRAGPPRAATRPDRASRAAPCRTNPSRGQSRARAP